MARRARPAVRRPEPLDTALALGLLAAAALEAGAGSVGGSSGAKVLGSVLATVPLAWRSSAPLAATVVATTGVALSSILGFDTNDTLVVSLAPLLAVYSLAERSGTTRLAIGVAVALGAYGVTALAIGLPLPLAGVVVAAAVGRAVRVLGFEADVLEARAVELERDRDERARAAVAEERDRIARELHDVIGHSIAVMGVQAGAVRRVLPADLAHERGMLLAVERTGRDAVTEMRRLLGLLRDQDGTTSEALPTLAHLDALAREMRAAGLNVDVSVAGDLDDLPPGRALAAFRILQEGLTNALKHAPGSHVCVTLERSAVALTIVIVNDRPSVRTSSNGSGHGLIGMHERAAFYGGTLAAGRRPDGGFAVRAVLPLQGSDP